MVAVWIGWIEVGRLSLRIVEVSGRYWSVPDRRLWVLFGPFSFRFVGYSVGEILDQNKKGPRVFP